MTIPLSTITQMISRYKNFSNSNLKQLEEIIPISGEIVTSRENLPGHITTSAVIINKRNQVLHVRHKFLDKWLLPGGHCEKEDTTLVEASLREAREETGISSDLLKPVFEEDLPIDIDIHDIPANREKNEPQHWHADFRFAFSLARNEKINLQEEEVSNFVWLSLDQLPMSRLVRKLRTLIW